MESQNVDISGGPILGPFPGHEIDFHVEGEILRIFGGPILGPFHGDEIDFKVEGQNVRTSSKCGAFEGLFSSSVAVFVLENGHTSAGAITAQKMRRFSNKTGVPSGADATFH